MNKQQLQSLKDRHNANLNLVKLPPKPEEKSHTHQSLVNGEKLRLRPYSEIFENTKTLSRTWEFSAHHIFKPSKKFHKLVAEYETAVADRDRKVAAYMKMAQPILDQAELDKKANAYELNKLLTEAAKLAGLIKTPTRKERYENS